MAEVDLVDEVGISNEDDLVVVESVVVALDVVVANVASIFCC